MFARSVALTLLGVLTLGASPQGTSAEATRIAAVLDELHAAASHADGERYFKLFAPEAVFLGTDAGERWPLEKFRAYAMRRFEQGTGWTYTVRSRNVSVARQGDTAWFDEALDNAKYGACRGTGVLVKQGEAWRIAQYNLTIPIPNDLALQVAELIRAHEARGGTARP